MADWRRVDNTYPLYLQYIFHPTAATALSACIFLPLLLYSGGVFPLPLQKPQMLSQAAKRIPLLSLSVGIGIIYVRISPIPPQLVMRGKSFLYDYIRRFNAVYKKYHICPR
ncbi:hypothetical protein E4N70_05080 [Treponema vincentii]|uniref:hypothetical protein n=1 Tax=Treponema vincentii TaxID=69710 RepID=UPI0020A30266|nr:hypothetical protein [Treponema vincentii]UTC60931.1 hypothetical protein E4N70_05080 [Treponema vincentii]